MFGEMDLARGLIISTGREDLSEGIIGRYTIRALFSRDKSFRGATLLIDEILFLL